MLRATQLALVICSIAAVSCVHEQVQVAKLPLEISSTSNKPVEKYPARPPVVQPPTLPYGWEQFQRGPRAKRQHIESEINPNNNHHIHHTGSSHQEFVQPNRPVHIFHRPSGPQPRNSRKRRQVQVNDQVHVAEINELKPYEQVQVAQITPTEHVQVAQLTPSEQVQVAELNHGESVQVAQPYVSPFKNPLLREARNRRQVQVNDQVNVDQINPSDQVQVGQTNPSDQVQVAEHRPNPFARNSRRRRQINHNNMNSPQRPDISPAFVDFGPSGTLNGAPGNPSTRPIFVQPQRPNNSPIFADQGRPRRNIIVKTGGASDADLSPCFVSCDDPK